MTERLKKVNGGMINKMNQRLSRRKYWKNGAIVGLNGRLIIFDEQVQR
jgi:hypothetical protein